MNDPCNAAHGATSLLIACQNLHCMKPAECNRPLLKTIANPFICDKVLCIFQSSKTMSRCKDLKLVGLIQGVPVIVGRYNRMLIFTHRHGAPGVLGGAEPEPGENPFLHVYYHQALEKQIENDDPAEAAPLSSGSSVRVTPLHDAQHQVMRSWCAKWPTWVTRRGPFNVARYRQRLEELGR